MLLTVLAFLGGVLTILSPCILPVLPFVFTRAAEPFWLLAYAAGSAVSLAAALLLGGQVFAALKRSLGAEEWIRRALGGAVVVGALAIAFGLDTGFLARVSTPSTTRLEEALFGRLMPERKAPDDDVLLPGPAMAGSGAMMSRNPAMAGGAMMSARGAGASTLPVVGKLPPLDGATEWLNSPPLTADALRGHVVVVDFWTYSCINCLRALPYVKAWYEK